MAVEMVPLRFSKGGYNIRTNNSDITSSEDIEDFFNELKISGDYSQLSQAYKLLKDADFIDLTTFFNEFHEFEKNIFELNGIDYKPILEAYSKNVETMKKSYINFVIEYFKDYNSKIINLINKDEDKMEFYEDRNSIVVDLLLNIGSRLDSGYVPIV